MTIAGDESARKKLLLAAFKMPSVQTMVSRKSSITNAAVGQIIPVIQPTAAEIERSLTILGMDPSDVRCAYCGDKSSEWDHLRPIVKGRRPTGYISEIANLVPACGKCNQSKGGTAWQIWIVNAKAKHSPTGRGLAELSQRIARLEEYERLLTPTHVDFASIVGAEAWERYWSHCEEVIEAMRQHNLTADSLRDQIAAKLGHAGST